MTENEEKAWKMTLAAPVVLIFIGITILSPRDYVPSAAEVNEASKWLFQMAFGGSAIIAIIGLWRGEP